MLHGGDASHRASVSSSPSDTDAFIVRSSSLSVMVESYQTMPRFSPWILGRCCSPRGIRQWVNGPAGLPLGFEPLRGAGSLAVDDVLVRLCRGEDCLGMMFNRCSNRIPVIRKSAKCLPVSDGGSVHHAPAPVREKTGPGFVHHPRKCPFTHST